VQYGSNYDYKEHKTEASTPCLPLTREMKSLAEKMTTLGLFSEEPDTVIINYYHVGGFIARVRVRVPRDVIIGRFPRTTPLMIFLQRLPEGPFAHVGV